MRKAEILLIFFIASISGCNENRSIYLVVPDSQQIKKNTIVIRNDSTIGQVESVKINKDTRITIEISLNTAIQIDKTSVFNLIDTDVLGCKQIQISDTKSGTFFNNGDTVFTILNNPINKEMKIRTIQRIANSIDSLISISDIDSIKVIPKLNQLVGSKEQTEL